MLKFFRRIRHKLVLNDRPRKYLIYAFGEIALIMIGILLALQVNNLNELRKGERIKQKYIQALQDDLEDDLQYLQGSKERNRNRLELGEYLLGYLEGNVAVIDSLRLLTALGVVHYVVDFGYVKSTYNDLVASGKVTLFNDMEFKRQLDNYYLWDDWTKTLQDMRSRVLLEDYWDVHLKYVDPNLKRKAFRVFQSQESWEQSDFESYAIDFAGMKKDPAFTAQLKTVLYMREVAGKSFNDRIKQAEDLMTQLQAMER